MAKYYDGMGNDRTGYVSQLESKNEELVGRVLELEKENLIQKQTIKKQVTQLKKQK